MTGGCRTVGGEWLEKEGCDANPTRRRGLLRDLRLATCLLQPFEKIFYGSDRDLPSQMATLIK